MMLSASFSDILVQLLAVEVREMAGRNVDEDGDASVMVGGLLHFIQECGVPTKVLLGLLSAWGNDVLASLL